MTQEPASAPLFGWREYGAPNGLPVIYHHGMPGAHTEAAWLHDQARRNDVRLIVPDRPGIGATPFTALNRIADLVPHFCRLMDHLHVPRCHHAGWSSGGPMALAMAALVPERITGVSIMASYTHFYEAGLEDSLVKPFARHTRFTRGRLVEVLVGLIRVAGWTERLLPWVYLFYLRRLCSPADREILSQAAFRRVSMAAQTEAFRQGTSGARQDFALQYRDWGFRLKDVQAPVMLYQGQDDPIVVRENGEDLNRRLPQCDLRRIDGEGHFFPFLNGFQHEWMAALSR
tara:strand:- start:1264 stop:2124 length:861 start_codon:yes stop_codon:yes gene_type:complete